MAAPSPLSVTVHVARTIRGAFEGRRKVELGLPPAADVGDLVQALARLYPRLVALWTSEHRASLSGVRILLGERALLDLSRRGSGLRDGDRVYLASPPVRAPRRSSG